MGATIMFTTNNNQRLNRRANAIALVLLNEHAPNWGCNLHQPPDWHGVAHQCPVHQGVPA